MKQWVHFKNTFSKIKNHIFFIILLILFSIISTGFISYFAVSPVYQASTDVIIHQKELGEGQSVGSGMQGSVQFVPTYREIIFSSLLLDQIIEDFNLHVTADQLREKITFTTPGGTQVVTIAVTDENPVTAVEIANKLVALSQTEIRQLIGLDNIIVLAQADEPEKISGNVQSILVSMVVAAFMALTCGIGFAFFLEYSDRTIKDEQDILDILDIPFLGAVSPYVEEKEVFQTVVLKNKEAT